jgi:ABC-2 type transport system ATP-binding protein
MIGEMAPLEVNGARKVFGATTALDGVSLELRAGDLLALLGPNGAGKTTLVRAISGRVRLDAGEIRVLGRTVGGGSAGGDLGLVPQEVALYPLLTARENLEVFGRFHGLTGERLREAVDWALAWTALDSRADEQVRRFSGGMKRRLNIACGVLHRPPLILLDEPTVGVDPQSRERIYDMLMALRAQGVSLLLTTHQLEEAEARCDRVVIIDRGRNVAEGTVEELVRSTFGTSQTVSVAFDHPPASLPEGLAPATEGRSACATVRDIARDLPALLASLAGAGISVRGLSVTRPSLAGVFLALTGRELRE